jgi:hypothetical protein
VIDWHIFLPLAVTAFMFWWSGRHWGPDEEWVSTPYRGAMLTISTMVSGAAWGAWLWLIL